MGKLTAHMEKPMIFSEDSRVKIPCILHLTRLGYQYLSLKDAQWDKDTNILAERNRIRKRFQNPKFRRFANIMQFMIFSNNMKYEVCDPVLKMFKFAYGEKTIIDEVITKPILKYIYTLENENQNLAQLRDWLLPMLMNGQVTVA